MGRKTDCAQIVLTCSTAPNRGSAARQPGQPFLGIIDLGQAGVGVLPEVEEPGVALDGNGLLAAGDRRPAQSQPQDRGQVVCRI